jgi:TonB family protein
VVHRADIAELAEPALLLDLREPGFAARIARAGAGSLLFHILVAILAINLPSARPRDTTSSIVPDMRQAVKLVAPPPKEYEPTQKAPNQGKVTRELDVHSAEQAPLPQAPRFQPPAPPLGPRAEALPAPVIEVPKIEPPKIEASAAPTPPVVTGNTPQPAPPPPAPKPKIAFESVGAGYSPKPGANPNPVIQVPKNTVEEAMKAAAHPGGGGVVVGDTGDDLNTLRNSTRAPSDGRPKSSLQLLSDAQGVDFKPYLIQVLTAVRRNWFAVIPESARYGRRGKVLIQFIIDRHGAVPKLVIADSSGIESFDRAAVAGVSASYPFPPLPADYKGDQIRLQLAFTYNGAYNGQVR